MTPATPIDSRQFRKALGAFATGVAIVTTRDDNGNDVGLTVNSFNSVSLDPPMVLWSLDRTAASLPAFLQADHFAIHVLAVDQQDLSARFATKGADRFTGLQLSRGRGGIPLLDGCAARFECRSAFRYDGGDHEIFVGEVLDFEHFDRQPLIYQGGDYGLVLRRRKGDKPAGVQESDGSFRRNSLDYLCGMVSHYLGEKSDQELSRLGLTRCEAWVLNLLAEKEGQTIAELDAQLDRYRDRPIAEMLDQLIAQKLVSPLDVDDGRREFHLGEAGRDLLVAYTAASKAVEEDVLESLDHTEAQLLRALLKRVIRGIPPDRG